MTTSLTRQHFQAIADAIAGTDVSPEIRRQVAMNLAGVLRRFNPRFDRERFVTAAVGAVVPPSACQCPACLDRLAPLDDPLLP